MIGVAKFVVGSSVSLTGQMLNMTFRNVEQVYDAAGYVLRTARGLVTSTVDKAQHFAENPDAYADEAERATEEFAVDVAESAAGAADEVAATARTAVEEFVEEEPDFRPYEERTRAELYELATERDIDSRSAMNKAQLIEALREERA